MKKIKRIIILIVILVIIGIGAGISFYVNVVGENNLTISEKKWIDNNASNLITISIPNDIDVFGESGSGVFFDFINYLTETVGLNINNNTISYNTVNDQYSFSISNEYNPDNLLMYKDHYVLISKNNGIVTNENEISKMGVGVLSSSLAYLMNYYGVGEDSFNSYDSKDDILNDISSGTLVYALVPLNEFKSAILSNNLNILAHVSDLNKYYYFNLGDNDTLNDILTKEFNIFMEKQFDDSYNTNNYKLFVSTLGLTASEEDDLTNKVYKYGFNETSAYEALISGNYGGITAEYLNEFSKFAGVIFTYKRYKTSTELAAAAINGDIDLYYNYYNITTNYIDTGSLFEIDYYIIAHNNIELNLSNINGLAKQTVYVLENSYLYDLIKDIDEINIITYKTTRDLNKIVNKDAIIVIDANQYEHYLNGITNDYSIRYSGVLNDNTYSFRYKNETDSFYKLFNMFTKTLDPSEVVRKGITSYNDVSHQKNVISYIVLTIVVVAMGVFISLLHQHKKIRTIKIDTKVKKEDRLKFIDMLTSLKNRNYYNEKLNTWNKNTIYPQACIVLDINRVKELNDTLGHTAGDKQIQGVANILIRTQIDSSEIMRTDGNEFFIYLVGYSEKQVISYMKKLVKEFKNLPYDNEVAMGFSMIEDDTKLVEDAFNEASIQMRENKELSEVKDDVKKD